MKGRAKGTTPAARFHALADRLRAAMPEGMQAWLGGLPLLWQENGLAVTHAGADPACPLADQTESALLWGHPDFPRRPRRDGVWLVHGHVVHPAPRVGPGRIAVDTGAWRSGVLSAAWMRLAVCVSCLVLLRPADGQGCRSGRSVPGSWALGLRASPVRKL